jgi:hypothetical protein
MLPDLSYFKFGLTFVIEFFVILAFMRKKPLKLAVYVFLINLFSWPLANLAYDFYQNILLIELVVVLVESILLMYLLEVKYWKALLMIFVANAASFLAGLLLFR